MSKLKIAVSDSCPDCFTTQRECIYINENSNIDVALWHPGIYCY